MRKKILMVIDAYYPTDIRLKKEIDALISAQFDVSLLCYRRKGEKLDEVIDNCKIIRTISSITNEKKGFIDIWNAVTFTNIILSKRLKSLRGKYDVIHAHDLAISNTALQYAKATGAKAVLDLHENFPEAMRIWFDWRKGNLIRIKNKIFFNYERWFVRERQMLLAFDHVIAVVEEMKQKVMDNHSVSGDKITVVSNTEPVNLFNQVVTRTKKDDGPKTLVYVGGIGPHRGLDTAILGLKLLITRGEQLNLLIVGSGSHDNIEHLKKLARDNKIESHVIFTGQLPYLDALGYMRGAFLNLIPHHSNEHTDNTIPHKLFQIMCSEFPLMVSSSAPLKRIVEQHNAGIVFTAGDSFDFAEQVLYAIKNPEELAKKVVNARNAVVHQGLNWSTDASKLVKMYNGLFP